ncbi:hypothetical protein DKG75_18210 [Zavarzinia compransoris]|uniref:Uncharacterized protein n=2 Tax=Zavarzinia compransoris TaxID=1264899 RepID=A0A317DW17_9PROT|nr:hypothetical protein DKG75_18210 [Zavarzinia compransoris]
MILIALLVPLLGACADFNWRDAGRHSLESLCGSTSGCDRRCETDTGARTGDCRLGHGEP